MDGNTGLLTVANAVAQFSLLANLPVRFRVGDQAANPFWVANILVINAMRALTAFSASTNSIVNDETNPPTMFGYPLLESTTMDGVLTTGGHKGLLFFDANSYIIANRIWDAPSSTSHWFPGRAGSTRRASLAGSLTGGSALTCRRRRRFASIRLPESFPSPRHRDGARGCGPPVPGNTR